MNRFANASPKPGQGLFDPEPCANCTNEAGKDGLCIVCRGELIHEEFFAELASTQSKENSHD